MSNSRADITVWHIRTAERIQKERTVLAAKYPELNITCHLSVDVEPAQSVSKPICAACPETHSLEVCLDCGATVCREHRHDFPISVEPPKDDMLTFCIPCFQIREAEEQQI